LEEEEAFFLFSFFHGDGPGGRQLYTNIYGLIAPLALPDEARRRLLSVIVTPLQRSNKANIASRCISLKKG
jgi:hypothetical protein